MYQHNYHIHFVGIGGIGMSGIASLLLDEGYKVSGSDLRTSAITEGLKARGIEIFKGHAKKQVQGANVVVSSSAISRENPELIYAEELGIPIISRARMLAELMRIKYAIAVAGAHGKTSTTSMIAHILNGAGLDPTVIIGGLLQGVDTNVLNGKGPFIVAEADESDGSFLSYTPAIAAVTNIDAEHLDFYDDIEHIKESFLTFINSIPFYGLAVLCLDNEYIQEILPRIRSRYTTFGMSAQADIRASNIESVEGKNRFLVTENETKLGEILLNIPGRHNVSNALAAIAVGRELAIPFDIMKNALEKIPGVKRRMEIKGKVRDNILIMDDYGHHPTEITATLDAVRENYPDQRLVVVFQPHRYSRTKALFKSFARSFYQSQVLVILPIYAASEAAMEGVDSRHLCQAVKEHGHKDVSFAPDMGQALSILAHKIRENDVVLTLGAGDVYTLGEKLMEIA